MHSVGAGPKPAPGSVAIGPSANPLYPSAKLPAQKKQFSKGPATQAPEGRQEMGGGGGYDAAGVEHGRLSGQEGDFS